MKTAWALVPVGKAVVMEHKAEVLKKHNVPVHAVLTRTSSYFTKMAYKDSVNHAQARSETLTGQEFGAQIGRRRLQRQLAAFWWMP